METSRVERLKQSEAGWTQASGLPKMSPYLFEKMNPFQRTWVLTEATELSKRVPNIYIYIYSILIKRSTLFGGHGSGVGRGKRGRCVTTMAFGFFRCDPAKVWMLGF